MTQHIQELHRRSLEDPEAYWGEVAQRLAWETPPTHVLDAEPGHHGQWFVGGRLNTCHNAVDRHVDAGRGDRVALIHDSGMTGEVRRITYRQLQEQVATFAGALRERGVEKGDRVIIYMPMVAETAIAMLACARLGAVHSVVFGGFAPAQLAARIDDAQPKVLVCASCGLEPNRVVPYKALVDEAIALSKHPPAQCVVLQRPQHKATLVEGRDHTWAEVVEGATPADCVPVEATDPLYILYTSGTTGHPKGIVRDNGGHAAALLHSMEVIYGVKPDDVFWAASDFGWVVGHSYITYAPLLYGCTSVIYEGKPVGTPDAAAFWRVIAEHRVATMFTAPTAFRAIRRVDPDASLMKAHDMSSLRAQFLAGERCDPDTLAWAQEVLGVPVIDHWWQTETGSPITAVPLGTQDEARVVVGSAGVAMPGFNVKVLDDHAEAVAPGTTGTVAIELPLAPGCLTTLWGDDARFEKSYLHDLQGYYTTADAGFVDEDGYVFVMGRTDDVINVAGHRLSTGEMEEVVASHPDVADCAVVGVRHELKGQEPVGLFVLRAGVERSADEVAAEIIARVREVVGPVASFHAARPVSGMPKTRSGKTLRRTLRAILDGDAWVVPATAEDPALLKQIEQELTGGAAP